jgi:hypothetical protein
MLHQPGGGPARAVARSIRIGCAVVLAMIASEAGAQNNIFDITVAKHTDTATDGKLVLARD